MSDVIFRVPDLGLSARDERSSGASFVACRRANATSEISILFLLLASPDDLLNAWYQLGNTPIGIISFIVSRVISKYQSTE
jgi:hypothetical protein